MSLVSLQDIRDARTRIAGIARVTPMVDVTTAYGPLLLKCENMQPTGAFKIRGATNVLAQLPAERRTRGVVTYSSGNHGQAMAYAARLAGVPAVVVMPETAPAFKVEGARGLGADVIFAGTTVLDRRAKAEELVETRGLAMVPPYDDEGIVAGQGTVGLEVIEQSPDAAVVFVPVGGGGLISGVAAAVKRLRPETRVVGVEPAGAAKMTASLAAGAPVTLDHTESIADGLLALRPGTLTFAHVRELVDEVVLVSDEEIANAVVWLAERAKIIAEPSGAASVAAAERELQHGRATSPVVAVVSGGNIALDALADLRRRTQMKSG